MNPTKINLSFVPYDEDVDFRQWASDLEDSIRMWCRQMTQSDTVFCFKPDEASRSLNVSVTFYETPDAVAFKLAWSKTDH
ncbi:hypothetical protein [Sphingomonas sp. CFBP 8760]|uniref:hypothetical protein n=1 Tax=Sphingomonas sp. CFBP 8760 TaxID=2775282 RepID=UPI0017809CC3|nr:hypothetical protein [Sphingomonas sp. CFBP 8760]MBD8546077.1 hypothetical protein [Sphingomonas sp. CFBP 8760]